MTNQYPYAPPPPPPPSSTAPANGFYGGQSYNSGNASRGGGGGGGGGGGHSSGGGRNHSHSHGHGHAPAYGNYPQDYNATNSNAYGHQPPPPNGYWNGGAGNNGGHSTAPLSQSSYHPNYAPQSYGPQSQVSYPQQASYPPNSRPSYGNVYSGPPTDYQPAQQWGENQGSYPPYQGRGNRGGYHGDRGGHRHDASGAANGTPVIRMGFPDQAPPPLPAATNSYTPQHYPPAGSHPPAPYHQSYGYPAPPTPVPAPAHAYPVHSHNGFAPVHHRGRGRDGGPRGYGGNYQRGDKFRHRGGQRNQNNDHHSAQKSDPASGKKKKRRTNTLGLTPGEEDDDDKSQADEEKHLTELLGADVPVVGDVARWLAERKACYPTKARIQAKKAAEEAKHIEIEEGQKPASKLTKDEERAEKLRRQLARVERKLEKRKRETNDEGDEMRVDDDDDDDSSTGSDDDGPETASSKKASSSNLPPPPITRADPSSHCKYYSTGGICGKKGKCRFVHDPQVREQALREQAANGGKMTLKQRLMRNDKDQEDMDIVQTIVTLRQAGRLGSRRAANATSVVSRPTHPLPLKVEPADTSSVNNNSMNSNSGDSTVKIETPPRPISLPPPPKAAYDSDGKLIVEDEDEDEDASL